LAYQFTPVIALLLIGLVYYLGVRSERTGFVAEVLDPSLKRITQPVLNAFRGKPPSVDRLLLNLSAEATDSLLAVRDSALNNGWLHAETNPLFPVQIAFGEYEITGLLNLDDGSAERLAADRWPFELRISNGDTLFNMQSFDMEPVNGMDAVRSSLMQAARKQVGDPYFEHRLVELRANNSDLDLYALHGRVDSITLTRWARGRGPVLRFDDILLAGARSESSARTFPAVPPLQADWLAAPIIASRQVIILNDPVTARRYEKAVRQMEALRAGLATPSDVFDLPALARAFALADILGGQDVMEWYDLRFLADSISEKIIVIPQRGSSGIPIPSILALRSDAAFDLKSDRSDFKRMLFSDLELYREYISYLDSFSAEGWLENLMERIKGPFERNEKIISAEFPNETFDRTVLEHNRTIIRQTLRPKDLVLAYTQSRQGGQRRLAIANVHSLPVEAVAIITGNDTITLKEPVLLLPRERDKPLDYSVINTRTPVAEGRTEKLLVRVLGTDDIHSTTIRTWSTFIAN
jgi:hypothetical protein